jgi:hypothetical protein
MILTKPSILILSNKVHLYQCQLNGKIVCFLFLLRSYSLFNDLKVAITAQKEEVLDRDLVVFEILETGPSFINTAQIDPHMAEAIRKKFDAPPGLFTVILVGKDGGVKLRQSPEVKLKDIFALIDAMSMRQQEMRQKAQ